MGLDSIVIYPNLTDLQKAFPDLDPSFIKNDLSYAAMLQLFPTGLIGIVVTSLIAALMSTISTHLNLKSSYIVNDFYLRFIKPEASQKTSFSRSIFYFNYDDILCTTGFCLRRSQRCV